MTLIIGAKCENGIVLGADGAATSCAPGGERVAEQPTVKLEVMAASLVMGYSGYAGVGQALKALAETTWKTCKKDSALGVSRAFSKTFHDQFFKEELERARAWANSTNDRRRLSHLDGEMLVATSPIGEEPRLFCFTNGMPPEEIRPANPFCAIGSGQNIATPFLTFLRRLFWPDGGTPNIAEGKMVVLWTLRHVVKTAPGGVRDPYQMVVMLPKTDRVYEAHELSEDEIKEARDYIRSAESNIAEVIRGNARAVAAIPKAPAG